METVPMTQEGLDKLRAELKLMEEHRPKVLLQVKEAREKGDLSENAEYHAAREDLSMLEGRIREMKDKISRANIVDPSKIGGDTIVFGATVKLLSLSDNEEEEYVLVGEGENDPLNGRILTTSPMGQALLTKKVGDKVDVPTPKGSLKFKVLKIEYK
jgi:transcription elongation factor GreA